MSRPRLVENDPIYPIMLQSSKQIFKMGNEVSTMFYTRLLSY